MESLEPRFRGRKPAIKRESPRFFVSETLEIQWIGLVQPLHRHMRIRPSVTACFAETWARGMLFSWTPTSNI